MIGHETLDFKSRMKIYAAKLVDYSVPIRLTPTPTICRASLEAPDSHQVPQLAILALRHEPGSKFE